MNLAVYTLGCRLNQCESEAIADSFAKAGFTVVGEEGPADLYIVNTCTVTAKAEQKARRMIRLFSSRGASVVVTGCYAQMAHKELEALGGKLHIVPLERKAALLSLAGHINAAMLSGMDLDGAIASFTEPTSSVFDYEASSFSYHSRAYLKVQDGCDNECGYCRVHIARGHSVSLARDEVIRRALELEEAGFNEIVLTGVNLTMYDHDGEGLGGMMLALIPRLKPTTRLRLSSMEPDHIDERLIEQNYGIFEGKDRQDEGFLANKRQFAYRYPEGGESMMQMAYRVYGFIEEVKKKYPDKNVLAVCHGGVCRIIRSYFADMTNDEFFHYYKENCQIEEYEL